MRDSQRQRVYDAENMALSAREIGSGSIQETVAYVDRVVSSNWWRDRSKTTVVAVKDGRGRRNAAAWAGTISIPRWARNERVVLHELAHILAGGRAQAAHGLEFAAAMEALVKRFMGADAARDLRAAYRTKRVRYHGAAPPTGVQHDLHRCAGCSKTSKRQMPWALPTEQTIRPIRFHSKTCAIAWVRDSIKRTETTAARRA